MGVVARSVLVEVQAQNLENALYRIVLTLAVAASALAPLAAAASPKNPLAERETGLWEIRLVGGTSLASVALGVQQALRNLPEAQREQMRTIVGGKSLDIPTVIHQCLTPELARSDPKTLLASHDIQCSELEWQESGGSGRFHFVCTNPDGDWTGEGRISNASARSFDAESSVQGKYKGQRVAMDMKHEGRWLGPDCGDVKPAR